MVRSALRLVSFLVATIRAVAPTVGIGEADALAEAGGLGAAAVGDEDGAPQLTRNTTASSTQPVPGWRLRVLLHLPSCWSTLAPRFCLSNCAAPKMTSCDHYRGSIRSSETAVYVERLTGGSKEFRRFT